MSQSFSPLQHLADQPHLLAEVERCTSFDDPAVIERLRRLADVTLVHAAIELVVARRKAADKLDHAERLLLDVPGVEQASSSAVAAMKAERFAETGFTDVIDLCCGIGGDAMALARHAHVSLIDRDPQRLWMARQNVQLVTGRHCPAACADVTQLRLRDRVFHLDPARRTVTGRRLHDFADYQPGPDFIRDLLTRCPTGAVKLGPGIDIDALSPMNGELQFISERGTLVQAVLWTGRLAHPDTPRRATLLSGDSRATLTGTGREPLPLDEIRRYLFTLDPAVERAGLIGRLCHDLRLAAIHPQLGLLTADEPIASPFLTTFEYLTTLPVRKVSAWLKANGGGLVEVKTRGRSADPDDLQRRWRGDGSTTYTVFVLRHDQKIQAHITKRF